MFLLAHLEPALIPKLVARIECLAQSQNPVKGNLLISLRHMPTSAFFEYAGLARFVFAELVTPDVGLNAALLLGRLAAAGHPEAQRIYADLQAGTNASLRNNAVSAYREATTSAHST
jgi:hypothetical protein